MKKDDIPKGTDAKLEALLIRVDRMDRRDRMRMWGGFFRSLISLVPIILTIYAFWYLYQNSDQVMAQIARTAAEQAAAVTGQTADSLLQGVDSNALMEQIKSYLGQ